MFLVIMVTSGRTYSRWDGLGTREGSLFSVHNRRLYLLLEEEKKRQGAFALIHVSTLYTFLSNRLFDTSFTQMVIGLWKQRGDPSFGRNV